MTDRTDLFGNAPRQASLFGAGDDRMQAPQRRHLPNPETIRQRLDALLGKARSAITMPWPKRDLRVWQSVFPQMTKWVPESEARQLKLAFEAEIKRLSPGA